MYSLPTSVTVKDREFHITNNGDFRMVLDCFNALNDTEMGEDLRVLASLIVFYDEINDIDDTALYSEYLQGLVDEMCLFFNCGKKEPPGANVGSRLIDWEGDKQLICAAVNNVAKTEVRELEYLHWWTFMGYYISIGESVLSTVVGIRNKIVKGKKLEKWEKEYRRDNPGYFNWRDDNIDGQSLDDFLNSLRDGGG